MALPASYKTTLYINCVVLVMQIVTLALSAKVADYDTQYIFKSDGEYKVRFDNLGRGGLIGGVAGAILSALAFIAYYFKSRGTLSLCNIGQYVVFLYEIVWCIVFGAIGNFYDDCPNALTTDEKCHDIVRACYGACVTMLLAFIFTCIWCSMISRLICGCSRNTCCSCCCCCRPEEPMDGQAAILVPPAVATDGQAYVVGGNVFVAVPTQGAYIPPQQPVITSAPAQL